MIRFITRVVMGVHVMLPIILLGDQSQSSTPQKVFDKPNIIINENFCRVPGMYGTLNRAVGVFIKDFAEISNNPNARHRLPQPNRNKLLLYGPPGNGKTELAKKTAHLSNSTFMHIDSSSIVGTYQNSGAVAINKHFEEAEKFLASTRGTMVMFFDEIDALGTSRNDQNSSNLDTERAMQTLWQHLSKHERTSRIRFIFATNTIKNLPKAFLNRLHDDLVVELPNPTMSERKEIVQDSLRLYDLPLLDLEELKRCSARLVKQNTNTSEFFIALENNLVQIDTQLRCTNKNDITDLLNNARNQLEQIKVFLMLNKPKKAGQLADLDEEDEYYCQIIEKHLADVENSSPIKGNYELPVDDFVAKNTQGLSVRSLFGIAHGLHEHMKNGTQISRSTIDSLIARAQEKLKLEEEESKRKGRDEAIKDLQLQELQERQKHLETEAKIKLLQLKELEHKSQVYIGERRSLCAKLLLDVKALAHGLYCSNKLGDMIPESFWTNQKKDWGNLLGKFNFDSEAQTKFSEKTVDFIQKTIAYIEQQYIEIDLLENNHKESK